MNQDRAIQELRIRLKDLPRTPAGYRQYTEEIREQVLDLGEQWRGAGKSLKELAAELGVSGSVFSAWQRRKERQQKRKGRLRPVSVVEDSSAPRSHEAEVSRPVMVLPNGIRVEGLELEGLVTVLSRLS